MEFFIHNNERDCTAYHEFYKGKWDGKTYWSDDSIYLHDNELVSHDGFYDALKNTIPDYDPYDIPTVVTREVWAKVREAIPDKDTESLELYEEANAWAKEPLEKDGLFTILGI